MPTTELIKVSSLHLIIIFVTAVLGVLETSGLPDPSTFKIISVISIDLSKE
jgi:hypothetical protein